VIQVPALIVIGLWIVLQFFSSIARSKPFAFQANSFERGGL